MATYMVKMQCSGRPGDPHKTVPIKPPLWFSADHGDGSVRMFSGNEVLIDESRLSERDERLVFGGAYTPGDPAWLAAYQRGGRSRHVRRCRVCGLTLQARPEKMQQFLEALARSTRTPWRRRGEIAVLSVELTAVLAFVQQG